MDTCKTPWDYCCEPREELTTNMATVRVLGPEGHPLKTSLQDVQGLKLLARVTVVGPSQNPMEERLKSTRAGCMWPSDDLVTQPQRQHSLPNTE